jgi:hypothetical protein
MDSADLDLDVDAPEKVPTVLRCVAERYYESHAELAAAWQDKHAGQVWTALARILERAALECDKAIAKYL